MPGTGPGAPGAPAHRSGTFTPPARTTPSPADEQSGAARARRSAAGLTPPVQPIDASYVLEADRGHHLDPLFFWVFDSEAGSAPCAEAITEHFRTRAPFYAQHNRRFVDIPGHLDHAYWVADDRPVEQRIVHDKRTGLDWAELLDALGQLAATALDVRATAWRIDVFRAVRDVPGTSTPATAVVLRGNHSLITGPIFDHLGDGFFGDNTEPVHFPGLGPSLPHLNRALAVARGIARIPRATMRYVQTVRAALREADRARISAAARTAPLPNLSTIGLNRDPGEGRTLLLLRLGRPGSLPKGFTVTALALTTMSVALQRYLTETEGQCPPDLTAFVTLVVGAAPESLGINRIGWTDVALHPDIDSLPGRAAAVQAALGQRRKTATAESLRQLTDASAIPSFLLPLELAANERRLQARPAPRMHTALISIRSADSASWALAGRPLVFGTVSLPLTSEATLTHGLLGRGDDLALTVMTSPEIMPDARRYAALLETAFQEVTAALRRQN